MGKYEAEICISCAEMLEESGFRTEKKQEERSGTCQQCGKRGVIARYEIVRKG